MNGRNGIANQFSFLFKLAMPLLYTAAGILLIAFWKPDWLPKTNANIIGILLIVYAGYRIFKLFKDREDRPIEK